MAIDIRENEPLAPHTTLKVGGPARLFARARDEEELKEACAFARRKGLPVFILGGGSNSLVPDQGFPGLVVKMEMKGIEVRDAGGHAHVVVAAGEDWDAFVARMASEGLWGVENLSLIPGTVGASPVQNIGAYGVEVKSVVESVRAIDVETGEGRTFSNWECRFGYRDSVFKRPDHKKYAITSATFRLSHNPKPDISYKDLREHFTRAGIAAPTLRQVRDAVILIRTGKFPDMAKVGTAGSFWKNPVISLEQHACLVREYPDMPSFPAESSVKVPLAWILDKVCGLKGYQKGRVGLYENQPLVLVTGFGATSADVDSLADEVARLVRGKTGIEIEREVQLVK